jgi:hypothetical protein
MRIGVNLQGVSGLGAETGLRYLAVGGEQVNFATIPSDPILPLDLSFSLIPPDPTTPADPIFPTDPILPLDVTVVLTVNENGQVVVTIGEISVPALD